MGEPREACFKPDSPYLEWTTTTTITTPSPVDFFVIPNSGAICPGIEYNSGDNTWIWPNNPTHGTNSFVCFNPNFSPYPCTITTDRYIRVADISVDLNRCRRYILELTGTNPDKFIISEYKLYLDSDVLNFDQPNTSYSITLQIIDTESLSVVSSDTHSVNVLPCECFPTTTSTTTSTTSTLPPPTTTSTTQPPCCDWNGSGVIFYYANCGWQKKEIQFTEVYNTPPITEWAYYETMDCGEVINLFTICDQTVHLDGSDQACVNKWYTEVLNYPCVNPPYTLTTITSSNINSLGLSEEIKTLIQSQPYWPAACDCNTPTFFHLSGSQYNCDCCPSTTTTFNPNTSTTQPPFSCCGHVILKFKTFTIPDCLNVYSSGNSLLYSTGFISTGDEFVTIDLFNLPCGFYMCVDAPASGTLWELDVSGIPYGTGVGMYCPVFQVSGGQNIYDIPYCFSS